MAFNDFSISISLFFILCAGPLIEIAINCPNTCSGIPIDTAPASLITPS